MRLVRLGGGVLGTSTTSSRSRRTTAVRSMVAATKVMYFKLGIVSLFKKSRELRFNRLSRNTDASASV